MSKLITKLKNINFVRKELKEASLTEIDDAVTVITQYRTERQQIENERSEAIERVRSVMQDAGLGIDELCAEISRKSVTKRQPTHKLVTPDGETVYYRGSGRKPNAFVEYEQNGGNLDELLIKNED